MIFVECINHKYENELLNIIRMFYGKQDIKVQNNKALVIDQSLVKVDEIFLISRLTTRDSIIECESVIKFNKSFCNHIETININSDVSDRAVKSIIKKSMYKLLSNFNNKTYPWGILSGIRPIKLVHDLIDKNKAKDEIIRVLTSEYLISDKRAELSLRIAKREREYIYPLDNKKISIYVGIPFCPSRCYYCSFTSNTLDSCGRYMEAYLDALLYEIVSIKEYVSNKKIHIESIYIGGGTPTTLSRKQLERLLTCINDCFGGCYKEFTCEAGRPDTIDKEKLIAIKQGGVTRLSINPQTMNQATLNKIGRNHSIEKVYESFELARYLGFNNINMDLILGLPNETIEDLENTLNQIKTLLPENITIHSMAIKRASILNEDESSHLFNSNTPQEMMEYCMDFMGKMGLEPYYLYRQKHMVQNMENIGFSKNGYEGIYNMQIIEEKQSNIAFGADSVSKIVLPNSNKIERQRNIKDLRLYIQNVNILIDKKLALLKKLWGD